MIYHTKNRTKFKKARGNSGTKGIQTLALIREFEKMDNGFKDFRTKELEKRKQEKEYKNERLERSIRRTRKRIREVLDANLDNKSFFLTLTFSENLQDYKKANGLFNHWIRRDNKNIKYLAVKELQERGAIHYHLIVFDCDNIHELANSWKHGFFYYKEIKNKYSWSISNYFTKYMTKDNQLVENNKRIFSTSRNLDKPMNIDKHLFNYVIKKEGKGIDIKKVNWQKYNNSVDIAIAWFGETRVKIKESD